MRRLTYTEGSSNKFWEISRNGNRVNVRWGRMGSEGQSKVLGFDSDAEAEAAHAKMLNEKLKKGYVDEGSAPPNVKTRQIDPRVVQRMDTVCTGIETFFERIRAEEKMNLVSSAIRRLSHAEIEAWEKKNKLKLPDEVFAFFLRGLSFGECFFDNSAGHVNIGFDFLDLNAVTKERKLLKSVTKNGGFDDPDEFELDFEQEQHLELLNKGIPMTRNEPQLVLHEGSIYHYSVRNDVKALDWTPTDYDFLARGTIAGHLLECGGQASGGNFNGGWQEVANLADLAFPIAEVSQDGTFDVYIHPGQGGLVTPAVLKEQLLYETTDPSDYLVADVSCDITNLEMHQVEKNRVRVTGVRGKAPTEFYKVSLTYEGAYKISVGLIYEWPDCVAKAKAGGELLLGRLKKLNIPYLDYRMSILGYDGVHGAMARRISDPDEVYLRMSFLVAEAATAERIAREMATHILCGIPTACNLEVGRATPQRQVKHWPTLIAKSLVETKVEVL